MNRRNLGAVAAAIAAVGTLATRAYAIWVESHVTAKAPNAMGRTFAVTAKRKDNFEEITLTVTRKSDTSLSPFTSATVSVIQNNKWVGKVPLEVNRVGENQVTFRFGLTDDAITQSKLEVREQGWEIVSEPGGKSHPEMTLGGRAYDLDLADFLPAVGQKPKR